MGWIIYRCKYCKTEFEEKNKMEEHVVNILAGGQSENFCMLMMLERQLENLMNLEMLKIKKNTLITYFHMHLITILKRWITQTF